MIFGKYINRYYLKNAPVLLLGLLALLMVDYIQLLIPQFYRLVINGVNLGQVVVNGQTLPFTKEVLLQHICLPMIWIVVLMVIGRFLWRICFFGSAVRVAANLRERMFDHSRQLSQQYYQVNKVGNLMSLYTNDIDTIQECFGDGILMFFDALVLGLMALYKMWRMDYKLTLLALIPALIMFGIGTVMGTAMTKRWEERQQAFSDLSDFAQENFSGIAVIKAFVKELKELMAFRKLNKQNEEINVIYTKIATLLEVLVTLFVESVICVILGYGGYLVYQGRFNAGQLVEYIGYFEAIVWPIMAISMLIEKTSRGKASLNRITELLNAPIDVADRAGVPDLENPKGGIEFRDLTFRYPDGEFDVLKNISFTIQPGESVGIVGKTGAGKTALVDLLLRTYNVPDGTLFVDGKDVNGVSIHSVRQACAYVPQDNFLFSDTIAHNIAFGVDDATPEDIERAASLADVRDNIVDFKDGYETVLGERGVTVSGGQKQRISIARALLKDAPILILDDSVSAVDTRTEKIILDNLKKSRAGKTTLLIAHRISTVEGLDKIIFLEDGRVEASSMHPARSTTRWSICRSLKTKWEVATHDESESASSRGRRHRHRVGAAAHRLRLRQRQENGYGLRAQHGRRRDPAPPLRLRQTLPQAVHRCGLPRPLLHLLRHRVAPHCGLHRGACGGRFRTEKPLCQRGRLCGCAGLLDGQHLFAGRHSAACGPAHHLRFA